MNIKIKLQSVLCGFIWSHGLRWAVRKNLVIKYYKHKRHFKKYFKIEEQVNFPHTLALCLIIKDESQYIQEWIEYHRIVGVDKFYIYDNESSDNLKNILKPYIKSGMVDYIYWPGKQQQIPAYTDAIKRYRLNSKFIGFIDSDEFIVPIAKSIKKITDILTELNIKYGLSMHWLIYGDSGHKKQTDGLVIERFTHHSQVNFPDNSNVKSIINPRAVYAMQAHNGLFIGNTAASMNENKKKIFGQVSKKISVNKIRVNHYYGKTRQEFIQKNKRGDVLFKNFFYSSDVFDNRNKNDIKDKIMEKYIPLVKKNIAKNSK